MTKADTLGFLSKGSIGRRTFAVMVALLLASGFINGIFLSPMIPTVSRVVGIVIAVVFLLGIILRLRDIPLSGWWSLIYIFLQIVLAISIEGMLNTPISDSPLENPYPLLMGIMAVLILCYIGFLLFKKGKPNERKSLSRSEDLIAVS